jgi:hypothetical protein
MQSAESPSPQPIADLVSMQSARLRAFVRVADQLAVSLIWMYPNYGVISRSSVSRTMCCTGGAYFPLRQDRQLSEASSFGLLGAHGGDYSGLCRVLQRH